LASSSLPSLSHPVAVTSRNAVTAAAIALGPENMPGP
jgi:hypothetical protein